MKKFALIWTTLCLLFWYVPANATWDTAMQMKVVCAAALLWTAEHSRTSSSDRNRYTAGAMSYMRKIPSQYHDTIDVALMQLRNEPYGEVKTGAESCLRAL